MSLVKRTYDEEAGQMRTALGSPTTVAAACLALTWVCLCVVAVLYASSRYNASYEKHFQQLQQQSDDLIKQQHDCAGTLGQHWARACMLSATWVPGDIAGDAHRMAIEDTLCIYTWAHLVLDCSAADKEFAEANRAERGVPLWSYAVQFIALCMSHPAVLAFVAMGVALPLSQALGVFCGGGRGVSRCN